MKLFGKQTNKQKLNQTSSTFENVVEECNLS